MDLMTSTSALSTELILDRIAPLRARLSAHPLYKQIETAEQLRIFMESHVFAVWDFMSMLKALQARLTCVEVPWVPTQWPQSRRFINEIVLGEESDEYQGRSVSHFELYLEAMQDCDADTGPMKALLGGLSHRAAEFAPERIEAPPAAREFVTSTFRLLQSGQAHAIAAAFTFGREDLIPDMFRALVRNLNEQEAGRFDKFIWYLERHIEVDGEDHGPLSLRMVADLCGMDEARWEDAAITAESALIARLALWDGIFEQIRALQGGSGLPPGTLGRL